MKRWMNRHPTPLAKFTLGFLPVLVIVFAYAVGSRQRLAENPDDKLMPGLMDFVSAIERLAFEASRRTGEYLFWQDTGASLERLFLGVLISAILGLFFGIANGLLPLFRASFSPLVKIISMIPPMAILPILFIIFGLGEFSKVILIVIGVAPFLMRDIQNRVSEIPQEILVKAQTLGASTWQIVLRVVIPQVLPRLIEGVRLSLGAAWLFLIAAEAIASTEGLGYRIFLVRRYLAMDVILPYVVWITLLAYLSDWLLAQLSRKCFPWYHNISGQTKSSTDGNTQ